MSVPAMTAHVTATEFLGELFAPADQGWVHLFALNRTEGTRSVLWRPVTDLTGLTIAASGYRNDCCIWFGPALRNEDLGQRRGGSAECAEITAAWVDLDVTGEHHAATNLPPDRNAAHQLLDMYPIPASAIIDTGGGLQAWWFLAEPAERTEAEPFLIRWGATWADYGRQHNWHVDNVFDIARVMRLPATYNLKGTPTEVIVTHWNPERRYSIDDLDQWTIEPPKPISQINQTRTVPYIGPERPGDAFNASVDPGLLLERAGFIFDHDTASSGERHYRAPHRAQERGATGATVYPDGHTTIWSETFANERGMQVKRPYDAFGLYAHIEHRGDWQSATETLARRGYGTHAVTILPRAAGADLTDEDDDWATIELVTIAQRIRNGEQKPTLPEVLSVEAALPLFYKQRVNSLFGESGGGKTWVALAAIAEASRNGQRTLFIDYEDNSNGIAERLVLIGLLDDEIELVDYRNPSSGILLGVGQLEASLTHQYELIVVDSTGEAMAAGGVDSNADREVAQWFAIVKRLTRLPGAPAILVLDHVPKDRDAPSGFAIGSQRKKAAVTGAAYRVDTLVEPAKGRPGKLKLTTTKDRLGNRAKGSVAAIVEVGSTDNSITFQLHLSEAQLAAESGQRFRPTVYMERVSKWLEDTPKESKRAIRTGVGGKTAVIDEAIEVLLQEGWIEFELGARGAHLYTSVHPFREGDSPIPILHRVTVTHRDPTVTRVTVDDRDSVTPPYKGVTVTDPHNDPNEQNPQTTVTQPLEELF